MNKIEYSRLVEALKTAGKCLKPKPKQEINAGLIPKPFEVVNKKDLIDGSKIIEAQRAYVLPNSKY